MTRYGPIAVLVALTLAGCHKTQLANPPAAGPPQLVWNVVTETSPVKSFTAKTYVPDVKGDFTPPPVSANIAKDLLNVASPVFAELTRWRVVLHAKHDGGVKQIRIKGGSVNYICYRAQDADKKTKALDLSGLTVTFQPQNGQVPVDPFLPYDLLFNDPKSPLNCPTGYTRANATYDLVGEATDFTDHSTLQHFVVTVYGAPVTPPQ